MSSLTLIAAVSHNRVIGYANDRGRGTIPWDLPADLRRFQEMTVSKAVVMGRTTFDTLGQPLPRRRNIVVTRRPAWSHPGVEVAHSIPDALSLCAHGDTVIIGGGEIYTQTIALADRLEITWVSRTIPGAGVVKFPPIDLSTWTCVQTEAHAGFCFSSYLRRRKTSRTSTIAALEPAGA